MSRSVVYPTRTTQKTTPESTPAGSQATSNGGDPGDGFGDKLLKYIPAEVIAFYVTGYVLAGMVNELVQWVVLVSGFLGTAGYLIARADTAKPPKWYFYLLAAASFLAWACGTSTVGTDLFNWPTASAEATGKLIVTSAVFLIPLLDGLLTKLFPEARAFPKPQP